MNNRSRLTGVLAIACAAGVFLALLGLTNWQPVVSSLPGNAQLGQSPEFNGTVRSVVTDFYQPPEPLPEVADGTVLKSEVIADAPIGVRAWRIMYSSRNNQGEPIAITGYYAEPDRETLTGFPLIGVAHGTTGLAPECGMSQQPFTFGTTGFEYWEFFGRQLIANGYALVMTDYEGMGAPGKPTYLLRKQGYDLLDSLRAAIRLRPETVDATNVGVIGHSEGAYVTLAAADMAASYAPDVMLRGAVSIAPGGVPAIPAAMNSIVAATGGDGPSPRSGYVTYLTTSWEANYPEILAPGAALTDEGNKIIPAAADLCQAEIVQQLDQPMTTYFTTSLPIGMTEVAALNNPITTKTTIPNLVIQGQLDRSIVPQVTRAFANQMCAFGSTVDYRQLVGDTHRSAVFSSVPIWTDWFNDRFADQPAPSTCKGL